MAVKRHWPPRVIVCKKKALWFLDVFCLSSDFVFVILTNVLVWPWRPRDKEVTRSAHGFLLLVCRTWQHAVTGANVHCRSNICYEKSRGTGERIMCQLKKVSSWFACLQRGSVRHLGPPGFLSGFQHYDTQQLINTLPSR